MWDNVGVNEAGRQNAEFNRLRDYLDPQGSNAMYINTTTIARHLNGSTSQPLKSYYIDGPKQIFGTDTVFYQINDLPKPKIIQWSSKPQGVIEVLNPNAAITNVRQITSGEVDLIAHYKSDCSASTYTYYDTFRVVCKPKYETSIVQDAGISYTAVPTIIHGTEKFVNMISVHNLGVSETYGDVKVFVTKDRHYTMF